MRFKYSTLLVLCLVAPATIQCIPVQAQTTAAQTPATPAYKFEVTSLTGGFRTKEPLIIEKPSVLQYDSPWFTANATVQCTTPPGESWTVGFIQQVDAKDARTDYGAAFISTEVPDMPVADTATSDTPWYNVEPARQGIGGGTTNSAIELAMLDLPWQIWDWREPLPPFGKQFAAQKTLQSVKRDQKFTTWLVAMRDSDGYYLPLGKINWELKIDISVDSGQPLGKRSKANPVDMPAARIMVFNDSTPKSEQQLLKKVMLQPITNDVDQLWWNPKDPKLGERTRLN